MSDTPKYARAPVVLTLIEIKHPRSEVGRGDAIALKSALRSRLPFHTSRDVVTQALEVTPNGLTSTAPVTSRVETYDSRTRRTRLGCGAESTTIEATEYTGWTDLLDVLRFALTTRHEVAPLDGVLRVGLRYIDEIRIDGEQPPDWRRWIAPPFLPPVPDGVDLTPAQQNCVVQYRTANPGQTVTVRFGAVDAPPVVVGDLRPDAPAPGPYFLLDTDVAWEAGSGDPVPEFDIDTVCSTLDALHSHAVTMFEHVLTDELRGVFQ